MLQRQSVGDFTHVGRRLGAKLYCRTNPDGSIDVKPASPVGEKLLQVLKAAHIEATPKNLAPIYRYYAVKFSGHGLNLLALPEVELPHQMLSIDLAHGSSAYAAMVLVAFSNESDDVEREISSFLSVLRSTGVKFDARELDNEVSRAWLAKMGDLTGTHLPR